MATIDDALRGRLGRLAQSGGTRLTGVGLIPGPRRDGADSPEAQWSRCGFDLGRVIAWDGSDGIGPVVAARLRELGADTATATPRESGAGQRSRTRRTPPMIEIVLRNGRMLRLPAALSPAEISALVAALDG
ncbi:MAG: hypothetical protein K2X74_07340 [Acetobacteraceae bacterium]|nr:hypothetical protein [Acetobacteraceae bacterium]